MQRVVAAGSDQVIGFMPIPPGGALVDFRADVEGIAAAHQLIGTRSKWGLRAVIVNLTSAMDTGQLIDDTFDQLVPKPSDLDNTAGNDDIDWDNGTSAGPFHEPGQVNWSEMTEMGDRPIHLGLQRGTSSLSMGGNFPHVDSTDEYFPIMRAQMRIKRRIRVKAPSLMMLAFASPSMDEVTTTIPITPADADWSVLTYPDVMFTLMLPDLLGLTETGAESPFAEAAQFLQQFVRPTTVEETAGNFISTTWNVSCDYMATIAVPGKPAMRTLKGGRNR